jgi:hypothetical protein
MTKINTTSEIKQNEIIKKYIAVIFFIKYTTKPKEYISKQIFRDKLMK